jgi:hypothetical protein
MIVKFIGVARPQLIDIAIWSCFYFWRVPSASVNEKSLYNRLH